MLTGKVKEVGIMRRERKEKEKPRDKVLGLVKREPDRER